MLNDAAGLYERDLERENLRRSRRGAPELQPAYTRADVERVSSNVRRSATRNCSAG
ncbi:hypothetical protein UMZ34_08160 [Halopseudomonas pachastrellae]|nr:hypothetical protein UMZ34_08160 [Halopseudomonas pachastrellae]